MNRYSTYLPALLLALFFGCSSSRDMEERIPAPGALTADVTNLTVLNSADDDFAPYLAHDNSSLVFTSNRASGTRRERMDDKSRFGEALYFSTGTGGAWSAPQPLFPIEGMQNRGTVSEETDQSFVYFGASYLKPALGGTDIYRVQRAIGQWGTPELVQELSSRWWDSHPALSADGGMMIFASDREDAPPTSETQGERKPALWMSIRSGGGWAPPVKLPAPVNSGDGEVSPHFGPDGYLYFATRRFDDAGFDIVRSRRTADGWSEPERLPAPVNSAHDDVFPFLSGDRMTIFFASDRPGGLGGLDLYSASMPHRVRLAGSVTIIDEGKGARPAIQTQIRIEDLMTKKQWSVSTDENGQYSTDLLSNRRYLIIPGGAECYRRAEPSEIDVPVPFALDTTITRDFALERAAFPAFQLGRYNIPFFVTGYYHPNTSANLSRLQDRLNKGELNVAPGGNTPYIDMGDEDYRSYAPRIEAIFDTVYHTIIDNILPSFNECALATERLKIEVRGFVDPRGLAYGSYVDKTVRTDNMRIERGTVMSGQDGNRKLAELRAFYTLEMIDTDLAQRSSAYRELKSQNRVVLSAYGVGIDVETGGPRLQDPAKRRIDIRLLIVGGK